MNLTAYNCCIGLQFHVIKIVHFCSEYECINNLAISRSSGP